MPAHIISAMRRFLITAFFSLLFTTGGASQPPSAAVVTALQAALAAPRVVVDTDCILSGPVKDDFIAYRRFGVEL